MPNRLGGRRDGGFIIVAVLWILAALATLSLVYSLYALESAITAGKLRLSAVEVHV